MAGHDGGDDTVLPCFASQCNCAFGRRATCCQAVCTSGLGRCAAAMSQKSIVASRARAATPAEAQAPTPDIDDRCPLQCEPFHARSDVRTVGFCKVYRSECKSYS